MSVKSLIITGFINPLKPTASSSSSGSSSSLSLVKKPLTSSLFNGVVAALKVTSTRTLPGRSHCHRQGGGALGTRMNLFDRFARVVKSYANSILSSFEDPEKILDQAVLEMNNDLVKMRQATAQVLASQKRLENKYNAAQQASEEWYRKAQLALQIGEEDLAREAFKRRKSLADNANSLKAQLDQQKSVVDNLVSNTRLLESKIQEAKSKKDTLKARAQSARTATKVKEMVGDVNTGSALAAFEKMEEKTQPIFIGYRLQVRVLRDSSGKSLKFSLYIALNHRLLFASPCILDFSLQPLDALLVVIHMVANNTH
ncbi:Membrane-associated 30 kDa protein [Hibiscus syriacus]|uniref:Membrane-associated 30 kDa protein n=1 Tax=Hibiscus syriacus TaxID=106335 RepID=A0A6A3CLP5_HIBSY|nr:Membrane-associated 30 kDa protein [Hibiscus syriacus]